MLQSHYRSPLEVTAATDRGRRGRRSHRLDALARRGAVTLPAVPTGRGAWWTRSGSTWTTTWTPRAVYAQLFGLVTRGQHAARRRATTSRAAPLVAAWREILGALGLEVRAEAGEVPDEIAELARQRDAARAARDFAAADSLRDRIVAAGFTVEDGPDGTVVRPA